MAGMTKQSRRVGYVILALLLALAGITFIVGRNPAAEDINLVVLRITIIGMGLSMGSFATALAYRLPRGLPYGQGPDGKAVRSMCPPCGRTLGWVELIPVVSWLIQGGRCQCGKNEIPFTYPIIEISTLVYTWLMFEFCGFGWADTARYFVVPFAIAAVVIAWQHGVFTRELNRTLGVFAAFVVAIKLGFSFDQIDVVWALRKVIFIGTIAGAFVAAFMVAKDVRKLYLSTSEYLAFSAGLCILAIMMHPAIVFIGALFLGCTLIYDRRHSGARHLLPVGLAGLYALFLLLPASI